MPPLLAESANVIKTLRNLLSMAQFFLVHLVSLVGFLQQARQRAHFARLVQQQVVLMANAYLALLEAPFR